MGKRYYCDYCDKTMMAAPAIVRTHNNGIVHQKLVQEHYQQFKDAETILEEESKKKPCSRFASGNCHFGSICRFSHYSREQIEALRQYVESKNTSSAVTFPSFEELFMKLQTKKLNETEKQDSDEHIIMYDSNGNTHVFPWSYNTVLDSYGECLPPSVKKLKIEDFADAKIESWG